MELTWNIKQLERKRKLYKLIKFKNLEKIYNSMINVYYDLPNIDDFINTNEDQNYVESYNEDIQYMDKELYNLLLSIYPMINNIDVLEEEMEFKKLYLSNEDLITLLYDIVSTFNDKNMIEYLKHLIDNNSIYIVNEDIELCNSVYNIKGSTFHNALENKEYIVLYKEDNVTDISNLFHEFMHAYLQHLINKKKFTPLYELEGLFGNIYANEYIINNHITDANLNQKDLFDSSLTDIFNMYINNVIINNDIDYIKVMNYLKNNNIKDIDIVQDNILNEYLEIDIYAIYCESLSYLVALDIMNSNLSSIDKLKVVINLLTSNNDLPKLFHDTKEITFYKDGLLNLKKEYILTHK